VADRVNVACISVDEKRGFQKLGRIRSISHLLVLSFHLLRVLEGNFDTYMNKNMKVLCTELGLSYVAAMPKETKSVKMLAETLGPSALLCSERLKYTTPVQAVAGR
jgi:hypothetical protein